MKPIKLTRAEAGRRGGLKGGRVLVERYGTDYLAAIGSNGGKKKKGKNGRGK